ncbi:hypothetical protein JTE90_014032 [Oedothorax gibbosus]|uniref:Tr-type G domain-containing protein n=1 Tax=Oedothorax gibbosus TaxID=931172 RepID=A0AAV6V2H0_9ARAC|nr:hypothetical protein JTE90_014032 [Oedothorax gibbosus]
MARHRNVRSLDADEEYDDFHSCYGHSVEDDFCISPGTEAQFLYNRSSQNQSMSAFFESHAPVPEEEDSEDEPFNSLDSYTKKISLLNSVDTAKLQSCVEALQDVVGDTIPEMTLKSAAMDNDFDLERTLNAVLQENAPKPPRAKKSEPVKVIPTASIPIPVPAVKSQPSPKPKRIVKQEKKSDETPKKFSEGFDSPVSKRKQELKASAASDSQSAELLKATEEQKTEANKSCKIEKSGKEIFSSERGNDKPLINLVVIGHVDAGKSTLMGHLLYNLGNISQRNMHKFERDSKKQGKGSFMYAWVLDETPEERNRGITMDVAFSSFETKNRSVTLLDAPGHKDFIPNMITGAAQADVAVLVVDSTRGEFETGFEQGGQTREHTMLIRSLGVSEIAVAVNKMDNIGWDEDRFKEIKTKMSSFLKQVGFKESDVTFVPCSGLSGENLASGPEEPNFKKWYTGPTLVDVIDGFHPPERPVDKPLRMCVGDVFKGMTGGLCAAGKIEAGFLKNGDKVLVMPAAESAVVKGITTDERSLAYGFAGDQVVLQLSGVDINNLVYGSMICSVDKPVKVTSRFEARLVIFNISVPITKGYPVILHYQSLSEQAIIKKLVSELNRNTGEVRRNKPRCLSKNTSAVVEIEINRPICIELFKEFKDLGRFMLRAGGSTIAAGLVTGIK